MIICGYPCIGKSTVASQCSNVIDLESSHFKVQGRDNTDWEMGYCKMAKELSDQGYVVFTSTHKQVRDMFNKLDIGFNVCYPAPELKEQWIERATERATRSALYKDNMALDRIRDYYEEDINDLMHTRCEDHLIITEVPYDLKDIIF